MRNIIFTTFLALLIFGDPFVFAHAQTRRPPGQPAQQQILPPPPAVPEESEFFFGACASWSSFPEGKPDWSRLGARPIIIGLAKGRDGFPREIVIESKLKKFAQTLTRNVLVVHESPWAAKDKFKQMASGDNRYCWLWLEANVDSLSLAWFHCWDIVCFKGSQAKIWIKCTEITHDSEWLVAGSTSHFTGHIHAWGRRMWLEAGAPYNLYYFTMGALLEYQIESYFAPYLRKKIQ